MGQGAGVGQGRYENGSAGRTVPVHQLRDGTAPGQGLLCHKVVENGPEQGWMRDRRDVRGTPGRQVAEGRDPRNRARLQVSDRALRLGTVQSVAFVQGRYQVSANMLRVLQRLSYHSHP